MHPAQFAEIRAGLLEFGTEHLCSRRDVILSGLHGHMPYAEGPKEFADIHVSSHIEEGVIYLFPESERVGTFTEVKSPMVKSKDNPRLLRLGWECKEELGVYITPYSVSRIIV